MTRRHRWSALTAYVLAITAAGFLLGPALAVNGGVRAIVAAPPAFWVVLAFLVVSQVRPIDLPRRGDVEEITTSTTFALGLLLAWGTAPAALALASASIVAGLLERKALRKIAFNAAQYILALAAAGLRRRGGGLLPAQPDAGGGGRHARSGRAAGRPGLGRDPGRGAARGDSRGHGADRGGAGAAKRRAGSAPPSADAGRVPGMQGGDRGGRQPGGGGGGRRGGAGGRRRAGTPCAGRAGGGAPVAGERAAQGEPARHRLA